MVKLANHSVTSCPICGITIHVSPPVVRDLKAEWAEIEAKALAHLGDRHHLRLWLWRRTSWRWVITTFRPSHWSGDDTEPAGA